MSLSSEPVINYLKDNFVCGYKDITNEPYCGMSGRHEVWGNAVNTTNGAGPHNIQIFVLNPDGTVLHCLPGYWSAEDLITELSFAQKVNSVYSATGSTEAKKSQYARMHLAHIKEHSPQMVARSHMQGFDQMYEARKRLNTTDTIADLGAVKNALATNSRIPDGAFKTTDVIMHERDARQPFVPYNQFDVVAFSDYGKTKYDKNEDYHNVYGRVDMQAARNAPELGINKEAQKNAASGAAAGSGSGSGSGSGQPLSYRDYLRRHGIKAR
ncbi:MAG: hypothetical protein JSS83_17360 [Cyanobacteria bacterium SZAS LIN-3]|nr:hypothetical protein [Cyanobacteria bacterium SZAS LIN-3]